MKKDFPYPNDYKGEPLQTHIQYQGTDLCMDWICECGELNHVDGDFIFDIECEKCGSVFVLGTSVKLTKLDTQNYKRFNEDN